MVWGFALFERPTVFLTGAGASRHYGYPTGEELVTEVRDLANQLEGVFKTLSEYQHKPIAKIALDMPQLVGSGPAFYPNEIVMKSWMAASEKCRRICENIDTQQPLVIDYFLDQDVDLQKMIKMLIAWVLLRREEDGEKIGVNINGNRIRDRSKEEDTASKKDNWIRFIVSTLSSGCKNGKDLLNNKVNFITFNYDLTLESNIKKSLSTNPRFDGGSLEDFFSQDRFLHLYGKLSLERGAIESHNVSFADFFTKWERTISRVRKSGNVLAPQLDGFISLIDDALSASAGIQTIEPLEKDENSHVFDTAAKIIQHAGVIYILGFGFDKNNTTRLTLASATSNPNQTIMFTNYNDSNKINKKVMELFGANVDLLSPNYMHWREIKINALQVVKSGATIEKSIRDVYGAFEYDFDI